MEVKFTFAKGDVRLPEVLVKNSFKEFAEFIIAQKAEIAISAEMNREQKRAEKAKLFWFASPMKKSGIQRIKKNMAPCAFGCGDIDESTPGAINALMPVLSRYSMLTYQTASHTAESPRVRYVCEFSRLVEPKERKAISESVETLLLQEAGFTLQGVESNIKAKWVKGDDYLICDRGVYNEQSYLYCPDKSAECHYYEGEVINVDALPLPEIALVSKKGKATSDTTTQSDDFADFDDLETFDECLISDIRSALWYPEILKLAHNDHQWISNGYRLASLKNTELEDEARALWVEWSLTAADYYPDEQLDEVAANRWDNDLEPNGSSYRGIFFEAQKLGWKNPAALRLKAENIGKMAASERGELLAEYYGQIRLKDEDSERVYYYNGKIWEYLPDIVLRRQLAKMFIDNDATYTNNAISAAVEAMKLAIPVMGETSRFLIGFSNGVYDLTQKSFRPHSAIDWLTNHNNIEFTSPLPNENYQDHAPNFYKWLSQSSGGKNEYMERIKAALFMVLANRYDWQLFLEITGPGGSGKSVFTGIAALLAGHHNTASGSVRDLDIPRERDSFVGKSLIILPDQERYSGSGAGLKAITGGDPVKVDPKHVRPFETVIEGVVMATNNEPMRFNEHQGGIARRQVIFPFTSQVKEKDIDNQLLEKIKAELPVIVRGLLAEFDKPEDAKCLLLAQRNSAEALKVKQETNPLYGFCSYLKALMLVNGMYMGTATPPFYPRTHLYHAYLAYMDAHGHKYVLSLTDFGLKLPNILKESGIELVKKKQNTGYRYNVALTDDADEWIINDFYDEDNLTV
ncbi:primase-like DNA-binding domain-containing protein [Providencia rettgeri]